MEFLMQPFSRSCVLEEVGESLVPALVLRAPTGGGMLQEQDMAVRTTVLDELGDWLMPDAVLPCSRGDGTVEQQQVAGSHERWTARVLRFSPPLMPWWGGGIVRLRRQSCQLGR
ncbi:hypothetical protein ACQJBY_018134 [Aegilops geniculata]